MFERRPIFVFILALNVCVLIWRISVQDTATLLENGSQNAVANALSSNNNMNNGQQLVWSKKLLHLDYAELPMAEQLYAGKRLLSQQEQQLNEQTLTGIGIGTGTGTVTVTATASATATASTNARSGSQDVYLLHLLRNSTQQQPVQADIVATATVNPMRNLLKFYSTSSSITKAAPALPFPADDFVKLIDLHNFNYQMSQPSCAPQTKALVLVHSAPHNYDKRQLIRDTWASIALPVTPLRVMFLLGAVADATLQLQLERENAQYKDLVQGSFQDAYRNMTYKHVMALKWFLYNCPHAHILIKVDDDVFVNTPRLLKYADVSLNRSTAAATDFLVPNSFFSQPHELLFCQQNIGAKVKRSFRSKWRVSVREYAGRYYPPYCPGYAIIYSTDVAYRLYLSAQQHRYFWIDDVHITGVLAQQQKINITKSQSYVLHSENGERLLRNGKTDLSELVFLFAWHSISPQQTRALWQLHMPATTTQATLLNYAYSSVNMQQQQQQYLLSMSSNSSQPTTATALKTTGSRQHAVSLDANTVDNFS